MSDKTYQEFLSLIQNMTIIDTHEHLPHNMAAIPGTELDVLGGWLSHYLSSDLISAGMSQTDLNTARDREIPIEQRWELLAPYWEMCRYTGYGRTVSIAARDIYGITEINGHTIEELNDQRQKALQRDFMFEILRGKCHIKKALLDGFTGAVCDKDSRIFARVWRPEVFIGTHGILLENLEALERANHPINNFDDWIGACDKTLAAVSPKINALKIGLAYQRDLFFDDVDYLDARSAFDSAITAWRLNGRQRLLNIPVIAQNFILHHILGKIGSTDLPVQIHTGLQEGNGNILSRSHPQKLNNLFLHYPNVKFDLFHVGWPFTKEAIALAKMFSNVTLDFSWTNAISPYGAVQAFIEAIDTVPINKISAFGGDYRFVEGVYGHLVLARENLARALDYKYSIGDITMDQGEKIARMMLYENPRKLFHIS